MRKDWGKIKNYYITHEISLIELAKKYGVSNSAINEHCSKEKWVQLKQKKQREINAKVEAKLTEKEIDKRVRANELHTELYDKGINIISMILDKYEKDLKDGKKRCGATATNMDYLMSAVAKCQKGQRMSLNIDGEVGELEPEVAIIKGLDIDKI